MGVGGLLVPLITSVLTSVGSLSHSAKWVCQVSNYESLNWKFSRSLYSVSIFSRWVEVTAVTGGNAGGFKVSSPWWTHSQSPFCHRSRSNYSAGPECSEGQTETHRQAQRKESPKKERVRRSKRAVDGNKAALEGSLPSRILRWCLQKPSDWKTRGNAVMKNTQ